MTSEYEVGQVFEHRATGRRVVVVQVRPPDHPKGNGYDSAIAVPFDDHATWEDALDAAHPFDVTILCRAQPSHGDEVYALTSPAAPCRHADG
jgi:hypothetical protein